MSFAVVIPTFNAGKKWKQCLDAITRQSINPSQILVIDSGSVDSTLKIAKKFGCDVVSIAKNSFGHGRTRKYAVTLLKDCDIVVFLTQDAVLASDDSLLTLLSYFKNEKIGAAYGRQLPKQDAGTFEAFERIFNYPAESRVSDYASRSDLGIKSVFISNSFAAYRIRALNEVGSFPEDVNIAEDMYVAAKMLKNGWSIAYQSEATVYHSHSYSIVELFQRYFDTGVFNSRQNWILDEFGAAGREGRKYLWSEFGYILTRNPILLFSWILRTVVKTLGYYVGTHESRIPKHWKMRFSRQKNFWRD